MPPHMATAAELTARQGLMKRRLPTHAKRTVRRHRARFTGPAAVWGMTLWVKGVAAQWPKRL